MIGARKCQVNQVEREFCSTALTREDIAVFEGHWPTFATNVVNNNKYFTHTMLETSYKKLNGMECDGSAWDYQNWDTHRLSNMNKKYSVSHIYSIYFVSVGRSIIWISTILLLSIVCLVNVYIHTNIVDGLGGRWVNCRVNAIYGYSCLKLTSFVGQGWAPGRHLADTGVI